MMGKAVKVWMIVTQVLMALSLLPWAGALLMSPMAFDSGFSAPALILVGVLLSYPLMLLLCGFMSWRSFLAGNGRIAALWTTIPFLVVGAGATYIHFRW
jgi:hypothetical protein